MMSWLWQQIVDTVTILVLLSLHLQFATWAAVAPEFSCFLSVTNWSCVVFFHSRYSNYCESASTFLKEGVLI